MGFPWHVAYTKPRVEKKVFNLLSDLGFQCYFPLSRVRRKWSDRFKWVEVPVFRSYIFVRIPREKMSAALRIPGMLTFLFMVGKPAVVRDEEIELIKKFLRDHPGATARPVAAEKSKASTLVPGNIVQINAGLLMGQEGKVLSVRNKEVKVLIQSLGQELIAFVDEDLI